MSEEEPFVAQREDVESAILETLERGGPCSLDELYQALSDYSWNQVFAAVDRLSRNGRLLLRRPGGCRSPCPARTHLCIRLSRLEGTTGTMGERCSWPRPLIVSDSPDFRAPAFLAVGERR